MNKKIIIPNEILLSRAVQAVEKGIPAIIPVKGNSMDPFIKGNKDCVELYPPVDVQIGDLVLALIDTKTYILHRVFRFKGDDQVILMGDGNVEQTECCTRADIKAHARYIIKRSNRRIRLDSWLMKKAAKIWRLLLPIRGILLRIYRRFLK